MKFGTDVDVAQRMNPNDFGNTLTFHLALLDMLFSCYNCHCEHVSMLPFIKALLFLITEPLPWL